MMFPLWTRATLLRWFSIAYRIAFRTSRFDFRSEIGFSPTTYSRIASNVACGRSSPYLKRAISPAGASYQTILRRPPDDFSTAAEIARRAAFVTSGPIPSPSIMGRIGSSGTFRRPSAITILWPSEGGLNFKRSAGIGGAGRNGRARLRMAVGPHDLWSIGTYTDSFGPTYQSRGRMIRLSSQYSRTWAAQPVIRATANVAGNRSGASPSM